MDYNIAIISPNTSQYSETFIRSQIELLPGEKYIYSEGYLPTLLSHDLGTTFAPFKQEKWWKNISDQEAFIESLNKLNIDVVLAQYGQAGVEVMNACREVGAPLIVHFHGFDAYRDDVFQNQGKHYQELFNFADAIIGVSKDMCNRLKELGCPDDKLHYIPYGVDTAVFYPKGDEKNHILAVGRFVPKKDPLSTIRAFKGILRQYPEEQLVMVGDGPLFKSAISLVEKLELKKNVTFRGVLAQHQVSKLMQEAKMFVQHSVSATDNDSEGTPLSIIEASASGLAVVSTKHAGIKDVVQDGRTGVLVDEKDTNGMTQAMLQLLDDSELCSSMGKEGRRTIKEEFKVDRYINQLSALILNCLKKQ